MSLQFCPPKLLRMSSGPFGLLLLLALAMTGGAAAQDREFEQTYEIGPNGVLSLSNASGMIRVTSWNETRVQVNAVKRGRAEEDLSQVQIQAQTAPGRLELRTVYAGGRRSGVPVDYDVKVPATIALDSIASISGDVVLTGPVARAVVRSTSGAITASRIGGELRAMTTSGTVTVTGGGERLSAQSMSGDVRATDIRGDATASSSSGAISLEKIGGRAAGRSLSGRVTLREIGGDAQGDSLSDTVTLLDVRGRATAASVSGNAIVRQANDGAKATSVSGSVEVSDVTGRIEAATTSGSVRLTNVDSRDLSAKAVSGDVRFTGKLHADGLYTFESFSSNVILFVPATSEFRLTARSRSGSVSTEFPLQLSSLGGERGLVIGKVGNGGADIHASTFSGSVYLKKLVQ
jgi:DUF4097 and DUF4098 domain-containing protein YvlB